MFRASTPTHIFSLPTLIENLEDVLITYKQKNTIILEKELKDCHTELNNISFELTQEEMNNFSGGNVEIQVRIKTKQGKVINSNIIHKTVYDVLDDKVM